jgi:hypothetical protein
MDIMFGVDPNGINTGAFLVNCKSPTALEFLDMWHTHAPTLAVYAPTLMEQTFVQYVLNQGKLWMDIRRQYAFRTNPVPKWDDYESKAREDPSVWSTEALRAGRLKPAFSQCSMTTFPQLRRLDARRIWKPGDVSIHFAGLGPKDKRRKMQEYFDRLPVLTSDKFLEHPTGTSAEEVALAYYFMHTKTFQPGQPGSTQRR